MESSTGNIIFLEKVLPVLITGNKKKEKEKKHNINDLNEDSISTALK